MTEQEKVRELQSAQGMQVDAEQYPTERVSLPSEGKFYSPENPLSSGYLDLKFPTAREEDILTSKNLIQRGTVIDTFVDALIADKRVNLDTILLGDKNALIFASRILAYGKEYEARITCPSCNEKNDKTIDLSEFSTKDINIPQGARLDYNLFKFTLPASKAEVQYKLLTAGDEKNIEAELKGLKQHAKSKVDSEVTTRLKYSIVSVNGNSERPYIKKFVDSMLSLDALSYRNELKKISPDIDMKFLFECNSCEHSERMIMPFGITFFWPSGGD